MWVILLIFRIWDMAITYNAEEPASLLEYTIYVCVSEKFCILSMIRYACFPCEIFDVH
jgi:hypothetical protein